LETCGYFAPDLDQEQLKLINFVYFDVKHWSNYGYVCYPSCPITPILENLSRLCSCLGSDRIILSLPLITGVNATLAFIDWIADHARDHAISQIRILPYHEYGRARYQCLGKQYPIGNVTHLTEQDLKRFSEVLEARNLICEVHGL
jgi:pyruvate formate lyase activating enzyme